MCKCSKIKIISENNIKKRIKIYKISEQNDRLPNPKNFCDTNVTMRHACMRACVRVCLCMYMHVCTLFFF